MSEKIIESVIFDDKNFNRGTEYGKKLIDKSIAKFGYREASVLDKHGNIIGGNKRTQSAIDNGITDIEIIKAEKGKVYALQFDDIELDSEEGRELALALNATAKENINFDNAIIFEVLGEELSADWGVEAVSFDEGQYSKKIDTPIYEAKNEKPEINKLYDKERYDELISEIERSEIGEEIKSFLKISALRHIVFNYENIADFYSHSNKETQELMENSALVIIDFNRAIELGYVKLSEEIIGQYENE